MPLFILAIIIAVVGAFLMLGAAKAEKPLLACGAGVIVLVIAFLVFMVSGFKDVPTKSIGVPVSFGKVTGQPKGSGLHVTWTPWLHLNVIDETIQTTTFEGCQGVFCQKGDMAGQTISPSGDSGSSTAPCLEVRIGGQQTACLDVTIQWKVRDSAADGLFSDYANQGPLMPVIENAVVIRELRQVANIVLGDYNPIQDVSANSGAGNSQFTTFQPKVIALMNADIGSRIQVVSILMPLLRYDKQTQGRLNAIQQQYGDTAIADQQIATNTALARADERLAAVLARNPNVLVSQCLTIISTAEKDNYHGLPQGLGCVPNSGTSLALSSGK